MVLKFGNSRKTVKTKKAKTLKPNESDALKQCEGKKPIFDREDIVCNQVDYNEDTSNSYSESTRMVYNSPNRKSKSKRSPSKSRVRRSSYTKSRSSTPEYRKRSRDRSPPQHSSKYERRRSRSREYSSRYQSDQRDRRKSRSKEYSPSLKTRDYELKRSERHRSRDHSPPLRPGEYRPRKRSRSRDYSPPLKPGEYRPKKVIRSRSPHYDKYDSSRRSRSISPKPSTSRRYSRSPGSCKHSSTRRSRSLDKHSHKSRYTPERSKSPRTRKHSRSPTHSYGKRYSRSPPSHKKVYDRRRSRSPHPPIVTFARSSKRRSRSHSPHKLPPQYPYYPETEFWFPPGFRPALYPFGPFPRGIATPILYPYPRIPSEGGYRPPFRPRLPIYNNPKTIVRKETTETITSTSAESSTSLKNSEVQSGPHISEINQADDESSRSEDGNKQNEQESTKNNK